MKIQSSHNIESLNQSDEQRSTASVQVNRVGPLLGGNGILHHLGFVVSSISAVAEDFATSMSARWDGEIIHDPIQRVRVAFLTPVDTRNPVFELVEAGQRGLAGQQFPQKGGRIAPRLLRN